jgi:hypothetical protein
VKAGSCVLSIAWLLAAAACTSARERCELAQSAAVTAFSAYVGDLDAERARTLEKISQSKQQLAQEIEPRIAKGARAHADRLYQVGSDGWLRGYHVAQNDLCMKDKECGQQKHGLAQAQALLTDLDERLVLARAAAAAVEQDLGAARERASAVLLDPDRPSLKAAQAAVPEAYERCKDVPPAEAEPE